MTAFHINPKTGIPGECGAGDGNCPYGGNESHYSSAAGARQAFELSMAGQELAVLKKENKEIRWDEWKTLPSGAVIQKYLNTDGMISQTSPKRFLAYDKDYDPSIGPAVYSTAEDAQDAVAASYRTRHFVMGDQFPLDSERELFTPHSHESYALREHEGITELAIIKADSVTYFRDLKVVGRDKAYKDLRLSNPFAVNEKRPMEENNVYSIESAAGKSALILHEGVVFRAESYEQPEIEVYKTWPQD